MSCQLIQETLPGWAKYLLSQLCLLALLAGAVHGWDMEKEVEYLLDFVEQSECSFVRNGKIYPSMKAREHLEYKYNHVRSRIDSAESFIDNIATKSSFSGRAYVVECGGNRLKAAEWLYGALNTMRSGHP